MKKTLTIFLVLILIAVVFAGCAKTTGTVTGTVTDKATGKAVPGAAVSIGGKTATTGNDGKYEVKDVPKGEQTLKISLKGYKDFTDKLTVEGGKTLTKDVVLSPVIKIGLVTDVGGRGDKSFNDSALRGLEAWAAGLKMVAGVGYQPLTDDEYNKSITDEAPDLVGRGIKKFDVEPLVLESKANEDYVPNLKKLADEGAKLVIGVGFMLTDAIKEVAPQYPNTYFMLIDGVIDPAPANVVCYTFKEQEGSFLVGALVGQMTKKNIVGFVGGMDLYIIHKFEYGYRAGVKTVNPKAKVLSGYTGNFTSADDGQKIAKQQFDAGADIVYHASGACGIGVIKEAQARGEGYFAVGVDSDQDYMAPGRVLTSMIKHVDYAVWLSIQSVIEGTFKPGIVSLGVKEGGVGISPLKYTKDIIPATVLAKVETLKNMIANGQIVVPDEKDPFDKFVPPTVP
ncbi:MAG: BMP family ABC transporter substrate-binding protein [Caldisericia bacterium]